MDKQVIVIFIFLIVTPMALASPKNQLRDRVQAIADSMKKASQTIKSNQHFIRAAAEEHKIPEDWIKAIILVESRRPPRAQGNRVPPTNIDAKIWAGLGGVEASEFYQAEKNIKVCALLLKRIKDRLPKDKVDFRFVASIYEEMGTKRVTGYGLAAEKAYISKPWESQ